MFSVVFVIIAFLNTKNNFMKSNCLCQENYDTQPTGNNKVKRSIQENVFGVANYVHNNLFMEKARKTFGNFLLREVERAAVAQKKRNEIDNIIKSSHQYTPVKTSYKTIRNIIQRINSHGYKAETHNIVTYDGYILRVQRILPNIRMATNDTVIIHHGLLGSAEDWLLVGPGRALPYLLSDQGYDVWLINARGNKYSRTHEYMNSYTYEFWDFSWHEMGIYDLPAVITYISHNNVHDNLYYVGHSMGGTALLVLLSTYPVYNQKLKLAFLLAPLAFMANSKGPLKYFQILDRRKHLKQSYSYDGTSSIESFPQSIIDRYCQGTLKTCYNPLLFISSGGKDISDPVVRHEILNSVPTGGSPKTLMHYTQLIRSGRFQMYDYGMLNNLKNYGNKHPPEYNLSTIKLPIVLFSSSSDWLSTLPDMTTVLTKLESVITYDSIDKYDHLDFVWAKDAAQKLYYMMIDVLDKISPRNKMDALVTNMM